MLHFPQFWYIHMGKIPRDGIGQSFWLLLIPLLRHLQIFIQIYTITANSSRFTNSPSY